MNKKANAAERLQEEFMGSRVRFTWFAPTKTLSADKLERIGATFKADAKRLRASKRLLDKDNPYVRALNKKKNETYRWWCSVALPYPEDGVRMIRRDMLTDFASTLEGHRAEIHAASAELQSHHGEILEAAKRALGEELFNEAEFPSSFIGAYDVVADYPNLTPDIALKYMAPAVYSAETKRIKEQFDEVIALTEAAFRDELAGLCKHLVDRLTDKVDEEGNPTGKPKTFHDTTVSNFQDFFKKFEMLNVGSSAELDALVADAKSAIDGVNPHVLRKQADYRAEIRKSFEAVSKKIDGAELSAAPKRKLRFKKGG